MKAFELAKLVFAAASLELGDFEGVYATFLEAFRNTDMSLSSNMLAASMITDMFQQHAIA